MDSRMAVLGFGPPTDWVRPTAELNCPQAGSNRDMATSGAMSLDLRTPGPPFDRTIAPRGRPKGPTLCTDALYRLSGSVPRTLRTLGPLPGVPVDSRNESVTSPGCRNWQTMWP